MVSKRIRIILLRLMILEYWADLAAEREHIYNLSGYHAEQGD